MHDVHRVSGGEGVGDLDEQIERALHVDATRVDERPEGLAGDELHREVVHDRQAGDRCAVAHRHGLANLVDGDHVRMVQRRRRPRLLNETHQPARVAHDFRRQDFQRDWPAQDGVARAIDVAHPAWPISASI